MTQTSKVEVYSKDYCPYCVKAKLLLEQLGISFEEIDLSLNPEAYETLHSRLPSARTVPQIFIDDQPIGGCDDLYALHAQGGLMSLIK